MPKWDRRSWSSVAKSADQAVRDQLQNAVLPWSPFWRDRVQSLGVKPATLVDVASLTGLPPAGERDVCPTGDPADAARLVLQPQAREYLLHADGPRVRKALAKRLVMPRSYRAQVENDTRPTVFDTAGLGLRYPLASTRSDLDVIARAGARLWQVLGLTSADVVVSGLPAGPDPAVRALELAAVATRTPLLALGSTAAEVSAALALVGATVLVLPSATAASTLDELAAQPAVGGVRLLLLAGAPTDDERAAATQALAAAGAGEAQVLAVHAPSGARVLWGECESSAGGAGSADGTVPAGGPGLHTYPDLDLVQMVDPETGGPAQTGELVLTQLGMRGSALLRWRTGDVAEAVTGAGCPRCGRNVARVVGLRRAALVPVLGLRDREPRGLDLRVMASVLDGAAEVDDWRLLLRLNRSGAEQLVVQVLPVEQPADPTPLVIALARQLRDACGVLPSQVALVTANRLIAADGSGPGRRIVDRRPRRG